MPDPAIYLGWYTENAVGPMARPGFRFNRGAIAYHLQSFTGAAIRDPKTHWVGPLAGARGLRHRRRGVRAVPGGTPHVDILMDRLLQGYSWGEAAYMAEASISWQMCFIGDPLYRPFAKK